MQTQKAHAFVWLGALPAGVVAGGGVYALGALAVGSLAVGMGLEYGDEINQHAKEVWAQSTAFASDSLKSGMQVATDTGQLMVKAGQNFWDWTELRAKNLAGRVASSISSKELDKGLTAVETTQDYGGYVSSPINVTTKHPDATFTNYFMIQDYYGPGNHRFSYRVTFPQEVSKFFYLTVATPSYDLNSQPALVAFKSLYVYAYGQDSIEIRGDVVVPELTDNLSSLNLEFAYGAKGKELHDMLAGAKTAEDVLAAANHAIDQLNVRSTFNSLVIGDLNTWATYQQVKDKISTDLPTYRQGIAVPTSQAVPKTKTGEDLVFNPTTDTYARPDGTVYTGEVDYVLPKAIPKVIEGEVVAVVPVDGTYIDVKTGESVGTVSEPPPTGGGGTDPVQGKIDWSKLKVAAGMLTTVFPFSIPWDVFNMLNVLNVEPKTPVFKIDVGEDVSILGTDIPIDYKFDIDFSIFDKIAAVGRWGLVLIFDISIIMALRRLTPD